MIQLLYFSHITCLLLYILRFEDDAKEDRLDNLLVVNDLEHVKLCNFLKGMQMSNFIRLQGFTFKDTTFKNRVDEIKGLRCNYNSLSRPSRDLFQSRESKYCSPCLLKYGIRKKAHFFDVTLPVTRGLFFKVVYLSMNQDTTFTTTEVYKLIHFLFTIMDNKEIISYYFVKHYLSDTELYSKLESIHNRWESSKQQDSMKSDSLLQMSVRNGFFVASKCLVFYFFDTRGNVRVAFTEESDSEIRLPLTTTSRPLQIMPHYFKVDARLLIDNVAELRHVLNESFKENLLITLDIDFLYIFSDSKLPHKRNGLNKQFKEIISDQVLIYVRHLVLRFSNIVFEFDLRMFLFKTVDLYVSKSIFTSKPLLPYDLNKIQICDCFIEVDFVLPRSTKELVLKNMSITSNHKVVVNAGCSTIDIENVRGDLFIPYLQDLKKVHFDSNYYATLYIHRGSGGFVERLKIKNAKLLDDWKIEESMQSLCLESIESVNNCHVFINEGCSSITLSNCSVLYEYPPNSIFEYLSLSDASCFSLLRDNIWSVLELKNVKIHNGFSMDQNTRKMVFEGVTITTGKCIEIPIMCKNITLIRCIGTFNLSKVLNLGEIRFDSTFSLLQLSYDQSKKCFRLKVNNLNLDQSITLPESIEELNFAFVILQNNHCLTIHESCVFLTIKNCRGAFSIPGVLIGGKKIIQTPNSLTQVRRFRLNCEEYYLSISGFEISQDVVLKEKVRTFFLGNIETKNDAKVIFEYACENLFIYHSRLPILSNQKQSFKIVKLIELSRMTRRFIEIPTEELHLVDISMEGGAVVPPSVRKLIILSCCVAQGFSLKVTGECENIFIQNYQGAFSVLNWEAEKRECMLNSKRFYFFECEYPKSFILYLELAEIYNHLRIRKEIKAVILYSVTFIQDPAVEWSNDPTPELLTSPFLQSIILKNCSFLYSEERHSNLKYLFLWNVSISRTVVLGESIETFILRKCELIAGEQIVLPKKLRNLDVSLFSGMIDFGPIGNLVTLTKEQTVSYKRIRNTGYSMLKVDRFFFDTNYYLSDDIRKLVLKNVVIAKNAVLMVNENCDEIEFVRFRGKVDLLRARNLTKVAFHEKLPVFKSSHWTFQDERIFRHKVVMPSYLKAIHFESVVLKGKKVVVNTGCENISLICCSAQIDLSHIERLVKLKYVPRLFQKEFISFPRLDKIEDLVLAYNGAVCSFKYLLVNCINLKSIILISSTYKLRALDNITLREKDSMLSEKENYEFKTSIRYKLSFYAPMAIESMINTILTEKMNILIKPIFNIRTQSTLESLHISGFCLFESNIKYLKGFIALKLLRVDYEFVSRELLENLPANIVTLEILKNANLDLGICQLRGIDADKTAEMLKELSFLQRLVIEGVFFCVQENFGNLPRHLELLKINFHDLTKYFAIEPFEKICLKRLVIFFSSENEYNLLDRISKRIRAQEMINYLVNFFEMDLLEEGILEDGEEDVDILEKFKR